MDPQHRDSMAFLRVVSGRFEKGMSVEHPRLGKRVRLPRAHRIFAQDRETTEEAFPGDVVGLVNPGLFAIGDTVSDGAAARLRAAAALRAGALRAPAPGLGRPDEGVPQGARPARGGGGDPGLLRGGRRPP